MRDTACHEPVQILRSGVGADLVADAVHALTAHIVGREVADAAQVVEHAGVVTCDFGL